MGSLIKNLAGHTRSRISVLPLPLRRVRESQVRSFTDNRFANYNVVELVNRETSKRLHTALFNIVDAVLNYRRSSINTMLCDLRYMDAYQTGNFWSMQETAEALYVSRDMSGKVDVKITVEKESNVPAYSVEGIQPFASSNENEKEPLKEKANDHERKGNHPDSELFTVERTPHGSIIHFTDHVSLQDRERILKEKIHERLMSYPTERAGEAVANYCKSVANYCKSVYEKISLSDLLGVVLPTNYKFTLKKSKAKWFFVKDECRVFLPVPCFENKDLSVVGKDGCLLVKGSAKGKFGVEELDEKIVLPKNLWFNPERVTAEVKNGQLKVVFLLALEPTKVDSFPVAWADKI